MKTLLLFPLLVGTACGGRSLSSQDNDMIQKIEEFKAAKKFHQEMTIPYPGAPTEAIQNELTRKLNLLATDFEKVIKTGSPSPAAYQEKIRVGLARFGDPHTSPDTEERERIAFYVEDLMTIVHLESSQGQLELFVYPNRQSVAPPPGN